MSGVEGLSSGAGGISPTGGAAGSSSVRGAGAVPAARAVAGVSGAGGRGDGQALVSFDPIAVVTGFDPGAAGPRAAGLQAQLLDWVAPRTRQFEAMQPGRLLPLLGLAVDRLAKDAPNLDELGWLGAAALERELRDHQDVAERRATIVDS